MPPLRTRVEIHPYLEPEAVTLDITTAHVFPTDEKHTANEPATSPPTRSMTLMVPGLGAHLPVLEPTNEIDKFITVRQVLEHIHIQLCQCVPSEKAREIRGTQQMAWAREQCKKRSTGKGVSGRTSVIFYKVMMKAVDMLRGRTVFRGLQHQLDARGANVWVVLLEKPYQELDIFAIHPALEAGKLIWDFKNQPQGAFCRQENERDVFSQPAFTFRDAKVMRLTDLGGCYNVIIPPSISKDGEKIVTIGDVLNGIHASMHVRYNDSDWPFWEPESAKKRKGVMATFQTQKRKRDAVEGIPSATASPSKGSSASETYLDTAADEDRRFLGIWHDPDAEGGDIWTLIKQPSTRPIPRLNKALKPGILQWDILCNPKGISTKHPLDAPATKPPRTYMCIIIEFMVGETWKVNVHKASGDGHVTARQVIHRIYQYLVLDWFSSTAKRLPLNLKEEISRNARKREAQNMNDGIVVIPGFKRVDMLRNVSFGGLKHNINELGEDEWKLRFGGK
ncbi:hypothetical protein D9619_007643 [Psilocybe cf. subviscida]|uniref:DUF6699 domain-containing protein n=1 Tax=Psilocybe cf. subviscida TaxID=2480587 RepID=A0A8H5ESI6_9AGAR|nr:hypothetical protein D9619_007643 [Psilocybe cf. subviscida]